MSRKDKKDFSVTDFDFRMDLDIEQNKTEGGTDTLSEDKNSEFGEESKSNTLDYYRDEMSRKEVEKLYMRSKDKPMPMREENEAHIQDQFYAENYDDDDDNDYDKEYRKLTKESHNEFHIELAESINSGDYLGGESEDDGEGPIDYEYILNLLKESKREDEEYMKVHDRTAFTGEEPPERARKEISKNYDAPRGKKTYSIAQMALTLLFVCFFSAFGFLAYRVNGLLGELTESSLHLSELRDIEERYYALRAELVEAYAQVNAIDPNGSESNDIDTEVVGGGHIVETTPPPAIVPDVPAGPRIHVVRRGDSLWRISQQIYGDGSLYGEIMRANNLRNSGDIHEGMELIIPDM